MRYAWHWRIIGTYDALQAKSCQNHINSQRHLRNLTTPTKNLLNFRFDSGEGKLRYLATMIQIKQSPIFLQAAVDKTLAALCARLLPSALGSSFSKGFADALLLLGLALAPIRIGKRMAWEHVAVSSHAPIFLKGQNPSCSGRW
jgi:hypothetical protein